MADPFPVGLAGKFFVPNEQAFPFLELGNGLQRRESVEAFRLLARKLDFCIEGGEPFPALSLPCHTAVDSVNVHVAHLHNLDEVVV